MNATDIRGDEVERARLCIVGVDGRGNLCELILCPTDVRMEPGTESGDVDYEISVQVPDFAGRISDTCTIGYLAEFTEALIQMWMSGRGVARLSTLCTTLECSIIDRKGTILLGGTLSRPWADWTGESRSIVAEARHLAPATVSFAFGIDGEYMHRFAEAWRAFEATWRVRRV